MKDSTFTERFNRWKNGESYWNIVGKPLTGYKTGKDNTMDYDYRGVYDKSLIPYYQNDVSRYGTIPEIQVTPLTNPDPEGDDPTKHYKLAMQRKGYPTNDKPLSPVDPIGEFAVTGAALKLPMEAVIGAAKFLPKFINTLKINKVFSNNINKFDGTVGKEYFKAPDKWYRITETPEVQGIELMGKNVTSRDAADIDIPANNWRSSIIENNIRPVVDNGWQRGKSNKFGISISKYGAAHGNTSLAAKGLLWGHTTSGSGRFPSVVLEGLSPNQIYAAYNPITKLTLGRSSFKLLDWEGIPLGERLGFHTGEMPLENLTAFLDLGNGRYSFKPVIPEKRVFVNPNDNLNPLTYDQYLSKYKTGKDSVQGFVSTFRPLLYNTLLKKGYHTNSMDNMLTQLAWESNYGKSNNAKSNYNYGGVKSGSDYAKYNSPEDFIDHYVDLIHDRYPNAFNSNDLNTYAKALKLNGYYEDSLSHYSSSLNSMKSLRLAIEKERLGNLSKYNSDVSFDLVMSQPQDAIRSYKQNIVLDIPTYTPTQQTQKQMIYPSYVLLPNKLPNIMDVYSNMINGRPLLNMPGQ